MVNLDTNKFMYDYNLGMANSTSDKRLRFHWITDIDQHDWHLPKECFDLVVTCHLSSHVKNYERALKNLQVFTIKGNEIDLMIFLAGCFSARRQNRSNGKSTPKEFYIRRKKILFLYFCTVKGHSQPLDVYLRIKYQLVY